MNKQFAAATIIAASLVAAAAMADAPTVPEKLRPAAGEVLSFQTAATGVQIYECGAGKDGYQWLFKGPEAELFDRAGKRVGKHYGGPTWESNDGSKVVAALAARNDAPNGAIPWLLLSTKSVGGRGYFSDVTSIQRISTHGGIAPAGDCAKTGMQARVEYSADYYFFHAR